MKNCKSSLVGLCKSKDTGKALDTIMTNGGKVPHSIYLVFCNQKELQQSKGILENVINSQPPTPLKCLPEKTHGRYLSLVSQKVTLQLFLDILSCLQALEQASKVSTTILFEHIEAIAPLIRCQETDIRKLAFALVLQHLKQSPRYTFPSFSHYF
jgi:hypothetical protein